MKKLTKQQIKDKKIDDYLLKLFFASIIPIHWLDQQINIQEWIKNPTFDTHFWIIITLFIILNWSMIIAFIKFSEYFFNKKIEEEKNLLKIN